MATSSKRVPGVTDRAWRAWVLTRVASLRLAAVTAAEERGCRVATKPDGQWVVDAPKPSAEPAAEIANQVLAYADAAERYATQRSWPVTWLTGVLLEGAWANVHAGEEEIVAIESDDRLRGQLPFFVAQSARYFSPKDSRRVTLEERWAKLRKNPAEPITEADRAMIANCLRGVHYLNGLKFIRVRSARNVLLGVSLLLVVLAAVLAIVGATRPSALSLCVPVEDAKPICPTGKDHATGGDVLLVVTLGLIGASVATARALSGVRRTVTPYSVVVSQGLLKTTLGALTAVIGILFLGAGFVPGVDDVDTAGEIAVYAVVFGYAQQLLTQIIDKRAADVTSEPPKPEPDGEADEEDSAL